MTSEELKRLKELCEEATPGPWHCKGGLTEEEVGIPGGMWPELLGVDQDGQEYLLGSLDNSDRPQQDTDFIAEARTALPALIAEVEKLQGDIEVYRRNRIGLKNENARLRAALKYYADPKIYEPLWIWSEANQVIERTQVNELEQVEGDLGKRAREALGGGE
jgi:hypothetical protein